MPPRPVHRAAGRGQREPSVYIVELSHTREWRLIADLYVSIFASGLFFVRKRGVDAVSEAT